MIVEKNTQTPLTMKEVEELKPYIVGYKVENIEVVRNVPSNEEVLRITFQSGVVFDFENKKNWWLSHEDDAEIGIYIDDK